MRLKAWNRSLVFIPFIHTFSVHTCQVWLLRLPSCFQHVHCQQCAKSSQRNLTSVTSWPSYHYYMRGTLRAVCTARSPPRRSVNADHVLRSGLPNGQSCTQSFVRLSEGIQII